MYIKLALLSITSLTLMACPASNDKKEYSEKPEKLTSSDQTIVSKKVKTMEWKLPQTNMDIEPNARQIKYGYELITYTAKYIGPDVQKTSRRYAGNHLSCKSCHLNSGQKKDSMGFVGITHYYPRYRGREDREVTLRERVNGCMERSLNGTPLPLEGKEMDAIIAYMSWLSAHIPTDTEVSGRRLPDIKFLERPADPAKGEKVYLAKCLMCHQKNGTGLLKDKEKISEGYIYPPLWGEDSYNDGAGMHRVITSAKYIKANMPFGNAHLSSEEAFDVAAYINSKKRPNKQNLSRDYPDISKKPIDSPYPPFADNRSADQHKYGPFH